MLSGAIVDDHKIPIGYVLCECGGPPIGHITRINAVQDFDYASSQDGWPGDRG